MERGWLLLCLLAIGVQVASGLEGRLFAIAFMNLSVNDTANARPGFQEVLIHSHENTLVRVQIPAPFNTSIFALDDSNARSFNLSYVDDPSLPDSQRAQPNTAIFISSEKPISISASTSEAGTTGAYLAMPVTANAKEFFLASWPGHSQAHSSFSVVSPAGDVCAELYRVKGGKYELVQALSLKSLKVQEFLVTDNDYTGYYINATRPIAVYSGHECAFIPLEFNYCDVVVEQVVPVIEWGQQFIMQNPLGRNPEAGYFYRVIAKEPTTVSIFTTGQAQQDVEITAGEFHQGQAGYKVGSVTFTEIYCNVSCYVVQYNPSFLYANETEETDPYMVTIPPIDHWVYDAKFGTHRYYRNLQDSGVEGKSHMLITTKSSEASKIRVNGNTITNWQTYTSPYNGQTYSWHHGPLSPGYYTVTSTTPKTTQFSVKVSGHGAVADEHTAWAYMGGYLITDMDYAGPWYNVTAYSADLDPNNPGIGTTNPDALGLGPGLGGNVDYTQDISDDDLPYYEVEWVATYYTKQRSGKIISRKCSEGYGRYVFEQELKTIQDDLNQADSGLIKRYCDPQAAGMTGELGNLRYHSEYTRGEVRIFLLLRGTPEHTLDQVIACAANLKTNLRNYRAWSGTIELGDENLIVPDSKYSTEKCAPVFFKPDVLQHEGEGWMCGQKVTVLGISGAKSVMMAYWHIVVLCLTALYS